MSITLPPLPEPDWILEVRQWLQDRDNAHAAAVSAAKDAEIAALRADFTALQRAIVGDTGASAILEAGRLREEVAGLREDAERYRWLRDKLSRIAVRVNVAWDAEQAETTKIESLWVMEHFRATDPESTDAAIDAARKGEA